MSQLISNTYDLAFDDLVEVRIQAINSIGSSLASAVNTDGAKIRVIPGKAYAPTEGLETSQSQIQVDW